MIDLETQEPVQREAGGGFEDFNLIPFQNHIQPRWISATFFLVLGIG